jgi:hypothetical protein
MHARHIRRAITQRSHTRTPTVATRRRQPRHSRDRRRHANRANQPSSARSQSHKHSASAPKLTSSCCSSSSRPEPDCHNTCGCLKQSDTICVPLQRLPQTAQHRPNHTRVKSNVGVNHLQILQQSRYASSVAMQPIMCNAYHHSERSHSSHFANIDARQVALVDSDHKRHVGLLQ